MYGRDGRGTRRTGTPHSAALGLQHIMRTIPADKKHEALKELKRTTGMSKLDMLEHIGSRLKESKKPPRPPTEEELQAKQRLNLLNK